MNAPGITYKSGIVTKFWYLSRSPYAGVMDRDLFAIFPDLPWPRIGHPRIRRLERIPKPPLFHIRDRRRMARDAKHDAVERIRIIAQNEIRQVSAVSPLGRALAEIIILTSAAENTPRSTPDSRFGWSTAASHRGTAGARTLVRARPLR